MAGLNSTLNIARSGLSAQQYGLNVTGNNIANVNNPNYSIQNADHSTTGSMPYGGYLLGSGVDVDQVEQQVNQLLENRLTNETSNLAAFEEAESYARVLEGYFDESSESSLTSTLSGYWNAWHDLADNPLGSAERGLVYEQANLMADRFNTIAGDLDNLVQDLTNEIMSTMNTVNTIAEEIAALNYEIKKIETSGTANDLRDQRNGLIDELAQLINVDVIQEGDGDVLINVANGAPLVNGVEHYSLNLDEGQIMWQGSTGYAMDITNDISGGKLAGWLDIRDETIPKYQSEIDELASEMIWAMNLQQSQGVGLSYYNSTQVGTYAVDESGWLSSYDFGNKIDYSGDVTVWVEDTSEAEAAFRKIMVDIGISEADPSNWTGTAPGASQVSYDLTVVDAGTVGDKIVTEAGGSYLAQVYDTSSGGGTSAMDNILAEQTLTLYNTPSGTQTIEIGDKSSDAVRSAASIAQALNTIGGVEAYASKNSAEFDTSGIINAQDGDEVEYSLYVDGLVHKQLFIVDSSLGTLAEQFEDSLVEAAQTINNLNGDTDLYADGLIISSDKGATLGIQDFEVQDNAGIRLDTFTAFDNTDTVDWTVTTDGVPTTSTVVSVDLTGVTDTTDQEEMSKVFYAALSDALPEATFSVTLDSANNGVIVRTLDGSNLTLQGAGNDTGDDATISLTDLAGTTTSGVGNTSLEFNALASDVETFNSETLSGDTLSFSMTGNATTALTGATSVLTEASYTGAGATTAAAIMGSVTILMDEGITIQSDIKTGAGLFGTAGTATTGSSIMTLGGEGGFSEFTPGETISFELDTHTVDLTIPTAAGATTDYALAGLLMTELGTDLAGLGYQFIQNGSSVSVIKSPDPEDPLDISISNFTETGGNNARLSVSTGSGVGTEAPENGTLEAGNDYKNFSTSSLYDDEAQIFWEKRDAAGNLTGESGLVTVTEEGSVDILEGGAPTLSFDISGGSLVAGNTLSINTDENGTPDPLDFTISNQANSVNDLYTFEVVSGGTVGHEPQLEEDELLIKWSNSVSSGSFVIEGHDPPRTPQAPVEVTVDGMTLSFFDGTLYNGDVFTITTDESGIPMSTNDDGKATGETMSDWHWTLDSFTDQFNRESGGLTAHVNTENQLEIQVSEEYHVLENVEYSGENGFNEENVSIEVLNWGALDFNAYDFQFVKNSSGYWGMLNDATGGVAQFIPEGGNDDGFEVDLTGDGVGDIVVKFAKEVSGEGYLQFDLSPRQASDINFAFGDDTASASGLLAAAGINTFFKGGDAQNMKVDERMANTNYIGSGVIDSETGQITEGNNVNAVAFSDIQYQSLTMKEWTFTRGQNAVSSLTEATLDNYYHTMVSTLGLESSAIKGSREFSAAMVKQLTEQRNSVSAVSLDEEMVNLIKYQQAYSAASKLLTTADDMLNTLLSIR